MKEKPFFNANNTNLTRNTRKMFCVFREISRVSRLNILRQIPTFPVSMKNLNNPRHFRTIVIIFLLFLIALPLSAAEAQIFRNRRLREQLPDQPIQERLKKVFDIVEQSIESARSFNNQPKKPEGSQDAEISKQGDFFSDLRFLMQAMRIVFHDYSEEAQWGFSAGPELNRWVITSTETAETVSERSEFFTSRSKAETCFAGFYEPNGAVFAALFDFELNENQSEKLSELLESLFYPNAPTQKTEQGPQESSLRLENDEFQFTGLFEKTVLPDLESKNEMDCLQTLIAPLLYEAAQKSIESGKIDAAFTVSNEGIFLGAAKVVDAAPIRKAKEKALEFLEKIAVSADESDPFVYTKNDLDSLDGFELCSIVLPSDKVPTVFFGDTDFARILLASKRYDVGETEFIIGIRDDAACFVLGPAGTVGPALRRAVRQMRTPEPSPRTFFVFSGYEFRKFLADAIGDAPDQAFRRSLSGNVDEGIKLSGSAEYGLTSCRLEIGLHGRMVPFVTELLEYRFVTVEE